ncbi:hypothetical protein A3Q56_03423 [Intoshia linei]|uniref:Uncharacterized protein n=1 Tax=Intoshia linei TaxID=1819745 RepID=A0A177B549_9BILA|nr:hypothetical protein A3Q56_03423 [Intoshia linei]
MNNIFNNEVIKKDKGLTASYEISKIITKACKTHTLGETVILPAISVVKIYQGGRKNLNTV